MRKVSVIAITATYLDMTFATTANITSVVETGDYFVRTEICTIILASFPMSLVNDMKGEPMQPPYEDYCYECGGYGDDYYIDDDGELKCRCSECPYNDWENDDE